MNTSWSWVSASATVLVPSAVAFVGAIGSARHGGQIPDATKAFTLSLYFVRALLMPVSSHASSSNGLPT